MAHTLLAVGDAVPLRPPGSGRAAVRRSTAPAPVTADDPGPAHGSRVDPVGADAGHPPAGDGGAPATGRDDAVVALYREHYSGLCRLASVLLGDRAAAEEVVQEAFLRTFAGWRRIRQPERARWYLRAAVVNLCRSRARRRVSEDRGNRLAVLGGDDTGGGLLLGPHAEGTASPADTDRSSEAMVVLAAIRALPERQRATVVLRYYEDLSEADIAATLGCAQGTVKSQLAKARASLQRVLGDDPVEPR